MRIASAGQEYEALLVLVVDQVGKPRNLKCKISAEASLDPSYNKTHSLQSCLKDVLCCEALNRLHYHHCLLGPFFPLNLHECSIGGNSRFAGLMT